MNCLKCGRETQSEQVFCQDCLLDMERCPVKPGTVVQLPKRRDNAAARRNVKRKSASLEDQVRVLRKQVRLLIGLLAAALILAAALVYPALQFLLEKPLLPGQNYSSVTVTVPVEPSAEAAD